MAESLLSKWLVVDRNLEYQHCSWVVKTGNNEKDIGGWKDCSLHWLSVQEWEQDSHWLEVAFKQTDHFGRHVYFLGWTPLIPTQPPNPPSSVPTQSRGVPVCSFLFSASICLLIKSWNWSVAELWGKNWDTDAHAHMTYQAPTTGLHNPTLLPILQNSTDYLMLAQFCKFGVNCCFLGLTHPAACTWARVPLPFGHVHRPPFTQFA
jgi:hypothetical protein